MKYKVTAKLEYTFIVDTEAEYFKQYCKSWRAFPGEDHIVNYARQRLSYDIIDDDGHGTISPISFDWTKESV
jgi:hypothetical protein